MKCYLGIDIGTSSTKGLLYKTNGQLVAKAQEYYDFLPNRSEVKEQDPYSIVRACQQVIQSIITKISPSDLVFISFSAPMHSLLILDGNKQPVSNLITWADSRANDLASELRQKPLERFKYTGTPIHPMSPYVKLKYLQDKDPKTFGQMKFICGIKTFVLKELTGEFIIDYSLANASGLWNIKSQEWDWGLLKELKLSSHHLPRLVDTNYEIQLKSSQWGLSSQTKVIVGGSDGALASLGADVELEKDIVVTAGTSIAIRVSSKEAYFSSSSDFFTYYVKNNYYIIGGPSNNGGKVYQWALETFYPDLLKQPNAYREIEQSLDQVRVGAEGLIFYPHLLGERAPFWDGDLSGSFENIKIHHNRNHFLRAVLEGIVFNIYQIYERLPMPGKNKEFKIICNGGLSQSSIFCQILSDIFDLQVVQVNDFESSAIGAIKLGDPAFQVQASKAHSIYYPSPHVTQKYRKIYKEIYKKD